MHSNTVGEELDIYGLSFLINEGSVSYTYRPYIVSYVETPSFSIFHH